MSLLYHGRLLFFGLLLIGLGATSCQKDSESIVSIALHPTNVNILYVATNDAVYMFCDGSGTWERYLSFNALPSCRAIGSSSTWRGISTGLS
jgi:hypothetical protein